VTRHPPHPTPPAAIHPADTTGATGTTGPAEMATTTGTADTTGPAEMTSTTGATGPANTTNTTGTASTTGVATRPTPRRARRGRA
jgi:hypothetical protein